MVLVESSSARSHMLDLRYEMRVHFIRLCEQIKSSKTDLNEATLQTVYVKKFGCFYILI
jgi:hypothetical protein